MKFVFIFEYVGTPRSILLNRTPVFLFFMYSLIVYHVCMYMYIGYRRVGTFKIVCEIVVGV